MDELARRFNTAAQNRGNTAQGTGWAAHRHPTVGRVGVVVVVAAAGKSKSLGTHSASVEKSEMKKQDRGADEKGKNRTNESVEPA